MRRKITIEVDAVDMGKYEYLLRTADPIDGGDIAFSEALRGRLLNAWLNAGGTLTEIREHVDEAGRVLK